MPVKKIAVLYSELSGYMNACLMKLREKYRVELLVYRWSPAPNAPFSEETFGFIDHDIVKEEQGYKQILNNVTEFNPEAVLMSGWMDNDYMKACRKIKGNGMPVIAGSDTQFQNTLRQKVAKLIAPLYLHSAIDVLWVSGERQRQLASRLGFTGPRCWDGFYSCDWEKFAGSNNSERSARAFIYVGRYIEQKGIPQLIEAYKQYRREVENPWKLICAGKGPLEDKLERVTGIESRGFTQPEDLPELFGRASAFVLPSLQEPWGVVVQEAAAAGLPLICSSACGATTAFLRDRYNGYMVEPGNENHLLSRLKSLHYLSDEKYKEMSRRSFELSKQFTPQLWARTFMNGIEEFKQNY